MGFYKGTMITAVASGTTSRLTGGKFANGAVTGAFVHMFNTYGTDPINKLAYGDPKEMAEASRTVATWSGRLSAILSMMKNIYASVGAKILSGVAAYSTYNAHLLDLEAGTFQKEGLIIDTITTFTTYCENPIAEEIYDEVFTNSAPYLFDYGKSEK